MRLAFITSSFPPYTSGVAVNAANITSGLAKKGHHVGAFIPEYDVEKVTGSKLVSPKLEIFRLPSVKNPFNPGHLMFSPNHRGLIARLNSFRPEIIHLQEPSLHFFSALKNWAGRHHVPLVCAHQFPPAYILGQFRYLPHFPGFDSLLFRSVIQLYRQANLVITPTQNMSDLLRSYGLKIPIRTISCGVDTQKFTPDSIVKPQPPIILYLGRISPEKHLETLIHASKYIKSDCRIWLAGNGKAANFLKSLSRPYPQIKFLGSIPEHLKPEIYNLATLFVMPSIAESQSITSLEAEASGLPLILTNAAALPELIDPNRPNGLLFQPDNLHDLAAKINSLLSDPKKLSEMGKNSRKLALRHDIRKIINRYEQAYLSLIN